MKTAVILSATRTPIGNFLGSLSSLSAAELGAIVITSALKQAGLEHAMVDEVIMGNVLQAGLGQNPARQAALRSGLPVTCPAVTINKVCGSGLKAVTMAAQAIAAGDASIVVAGGMESMSNAPYVLQKARSGYRLGHGQLTDTLIQDGLWCATGNQHMGITAENIADKYVLSRADQDHLAWESQQKAATAQQSSLFKNEITPVTISGKKGNVIVDTDEYVKPDTTPEKLALLKPAFKQPGTVTAGNASGINDGAAALILASEEKAAELGIKPLARIRSYASAGVTPEIMGMGPVPATRNALAKAGLSIADIDLIEANEAFAAQFLAVGKELSFEKSRVNVHGGAIALGHPIGASGARILVTLVHAMEQHQAKLGLATLCIGGGQGITAIIEQL